MRSGPKMSRRRLSSERMNTSADFGVRALSARGSIASPTIGPSANAAAGLTTVSMPNPVRWPLERLRPDERVLVALFYEEERSLAEIAQIMNLTLSNVKVRLHRLRGRLRHYMEE